MASSFVRIFLGWMKYFFSQRVVDEWNNLPESLVYANSVNIFKNGIDAYFSDNGRI